MNQSLFPIQKWAIKRYINSTFLKALISSVITYACPAWELQPTSIHWNCPVCKRTFSTHKLHTISRFAYALQSIVYEWLYKTIMQNKHKSHKIMKILIFGICDKAKRNTENLRSSNLMAVRIISVQVAELWMHCELNTVNVSVAQSADWGLTHIVQCSGPRTLLTQVVPCYATEDTVRIGNWLIYNPHTYATTITHNYFFTLCHIYTAYNLTRS
jgi:hypothetical protein